MATKKKTPEVIVDPNVDDEPSGWTIFFGFASGLLLMVLVFTFIDNMSLQKTVDAVKWERDISRNSRDNSEQLVRYWSNRWMTAQTDLQSTQEKLNAFYSPTPTPVVTKGCCCDPTPTPTRKPCSSWVTFGSDVQFYTDNSIDHYENSNR